jgi:4-amino-4-deoxy-L-arabinose transferase-like glycosyltransferase
MLEREWREASDLKPATVWLAVVVVVAAVLRFMHLGHGIPFQIGIDEPELMSRAVRMMRTGSPNPQFFDYPGLMLYVHAALATIRFLVGAIAQEFRSLDQVSMDDFFLWGRALTATLGVATVALVHQIGMRWGARHALLAAGLMAVMPMHVRESHYVLTDVPVTFFTALTMLLSLSAHEKASVKAFALAGIAAGLATGTKYTAGVAVLLPVIAAWMTLSARPSRVACVGAALGGCLVTFLVVAPYTLLDLPGFLNGFAYLMTHYRPRGPDEEPSWLLYLKHLRLNMGWPALILLCSGLVLGIVRAVGGPGRVRWTLLVAFPLVFFYLLSGRGLVYGRYLLPAIPFVCVLAAIAVISGVSLLRRFDIPRAPRTALIVALTVAAVLPPALTSAQFVRSIGRVSTQGQAYDWIVRNVAEGTKVAIERYEVRLPSARFRPIYVDALTDRPYESYKADGVQYLVASSLAYGPAFSNPGAFKGTHDAYMGLLTLGNEVARFTPQPGQPGPELIIVEVR